MARTVRCSYAEEENFMQYLFKIVFAVAVGSLVCAAAVLAEPATTRSATRPDDPKKVVQFSEREPAPKTALQNLSARLELAVNQKSPGLTLTVVITNAGDTACDIVNPIDTFHTLVTNSLGHKVSADWLPKGVINSNQPGHGILGFVVRDMRLKAGDGHDLPADTDADAVTLPAGGRLELEVRVKSRTERPGDVDGIGPGSYRLNVWLGLAHGKPLRFRMLSADVAGITITEEGK